MKKKLIFILAGILVFGGLLLLYYQSTPTVVKIALPVYKNINGTSDMVEYRQSLMEEKQKEVNEYLSNAAKDYRVEFCLLVLEDENDPMNDDYSDYDMVVNMYGLTLEKLEEKFMDLTSELKEGDLQPLYKSEPESYWQRLSINGKIYNTVDVFPNVVDALMIGTASLEKLGLSIPENMSGKPFEEWAEFFDEIYQATDQKPFISDPFGGNWSSDLCPLFTYITWTGYFQMVAPLIGISYEEPELGIQCIYESDTAKDILRVWKEYSIDGYVIQQKDIANPDFFDEDEDEGLFIDNTESTDTEVIEDVPFGYYRDGKAAIYPLQSELHSAPLTLWHFDFGYVLIPKETKHFEATCQFMNDMAEDLEFAQVVNVDENGNTVILDITPSAAYYYSDKTYLREPVEERQEKRKELLNSLKEAPAPGFVFDPTPVLDQIEEIQNLYVSIDEKGARWHWNDVLDLREREDWEELDERLQEFVESAYDAGLQDVIDEANRQLEAYRKDVLS